MIADYSKEISAETAAFKDRAISDFLSKHGLSPDDVKPGQVNVAGYELLTHDDPYTERWSVALYKIVDTASWDIKIKQNVEIKKSER